MIHFSLRVRGLRLLGLALAVGMLVGLIGVPTSGARASTPVEPLAGGNQTVSVSAADPYYGGELVIRVSASASENSVVIYRGTTPITEAIPMENEGPTTVRIATLGLFDVGKAYTLRAEVGNGDTSGSKTFSITPQRIPAQLKIASTTTWFGSPLYGVLDPAVPTSVVPTGRVVMKRNGSETASRAIRSDRTFGIVDLTMTPGTHTGVDLSYEGDPYFTVSGAVGDITVNKATTSLTGALSATDLASGSPLQVFAVPSQAPDNEAAMPGTVQVGARLAGGTSGFSTIATASVSTPGQPMTLDLTAWAAEHPGRWRMRLTYFGDPTHEASSAPLDTLTVRTPGVTMMESTTTLSTTWPTVRQSGDPLTLTAHVSTASGPVAGAEVAFWMDGHAFTTATTAADGTASVTVDTEGTTARAFYVSTTANAAYTESASSNITISGRIDTGIDVQAPAQLPANTAFELPVSLTDASAGGLVEVLRDDQVIASAAVPSPSIQVPGLPAGVHVLLIRYSGDATHLPTHIPVTVTVVKDQDPVVTKVRSTTSAKVTGLKKHKATLKVRVIADKAVTGPVKIMLGKKVVGRGVLKAKHHGKLKLTTKKLPAGKLKLRVRYAGSATVLASSSRVITLRVR